jgi:PAS domain S-box-containing protein
VQAAPVLASSISEAIDDETCFVVITEESFGSVNMVRLAKKLETQPAWSDLAFLILTHRGGGPERKAAAARLSDMLGNVTFIERPFHPTSFISIARSMLKGRHRQFDARARIDELHESEERLQTALSAGRLGSWLLDVESGQLTTSTTSRAIFGLDPQVELTYENALAAIHADDVEGVRAAVREAIEIGRDYAVKHRTIWPDGSLHWTEVHARRVRSRSGKLRLVGVMVDITDRENAERSLQNLNELLEARVAERTKELELAHTRVLAEVRQREETERQLLQAQKMEAIGQLTGGVAHDFNNLLMAVIGNLELLRKHLPNDQRAQRLIDGGLQGANRGATLTQRLLAFARRQDLDLAAIDIAGLCRGLSDLLAKSVGPAIELSYDVGNDLPPALVDVNQVELALLNLVVNARDAMPNGGIIKLAATDVTHDVGSELAPGRYVVISVTDTGHGMDTQTLSKATEPFFSTKELGKGTGLGLSMIQGLAIQLNGALKLKSEFGKGTTAELWLPATQPAAAPEPLIEHDISAFRAPSSVRQRRILVVDDDALIAMSTVDMLEDLGHAVLEANSGRAALDILAQGEAVDLVVTDYSMPKMNGGELATEIRRLYPSMPILLATGYADLPPGTQIELPRLSKPYSQHHLEREIEKLFGGEMS